MSKSFTILLYLLIFNEGAKGQRIFSNYKYPLVDFRMPLDITPPALTGSFGEIRANHFHSGIDFRTNQREGYPVYAIADGYISRVRIQNSGFGLALYINHPNGFTSVYGHLQRFIPRISKIAKDIEYDKKSFEIDEFPVSTLIPVYKGEVIAYSGNRGSSGGPHLHFEIRDTKTEATINPQLFGINIPDNIPPVIYSIYVYKLNGKPFNESITKQYYQVTGSAGKFRLLNSKAIVLSGEVGFGIITTDKHNGFSGTNGVYSIELEIDGKIIFISSLERFLFENSKAINAHIDYPSYIKTKKSIQKSFVDPGNQLNIYNSLVNNGRITFSDGTLHSLKYTVTDSKGNRSVLPFNVMAKSLDIKEDTMAKPTILTSQVLFPYDQPNEFIDNDIKVFLPKGTLYNNLSFIKKKLTKPPGNAYSEVHQIHNSLTPLHTGFELWIKADANLNPYKDKALIVNVNRSSQGGFYEDGYVKAKPRNFGSFFVAIDTIPPVIIPINIANGKSMRGNSKMTFKIRDNLSGIKNFNGFIDGQWILMEFDSKTASLWHVFDEKTGLGKHELNIIVTDIKENSNNYSITFYK